MTKRAFAIAGACVWLVILAGLFHSGIKDFLFAHPWLLSTLCAAPGLVIGVLGILNSQEGNRLQREANRLQLESLAAQANADRFYEQANRYREEANRLHEEANALRKKLNDAIGQIAEHTRRVPSKAEKNAEKLRKHLRKRADVVNADNSRWPDPAEIVEVDDELVTLFTPAGGSSSSAIATHAHCDKVEIVERPGGVISLKILERYGTPQNLGEIRSWGERESPQATPKFSKGPNVFNVEFGKAGSAERRRLDVFESADGDNFYMLVSSTGETRYGDNVAISSHFMLSQLCFNTEGFQQSASFSGTGKFTLFIKTR